MLWFEFGRRQLRDMQWSSCSREALACLVVFVCTPVVLALPSAASTELEASADGLSLAAKYIREHVWVIILAAVGLALITCLTVYCVCSRRSSSHGYIAIDGGVSGSVRGSRGYELSQSTDTFGDALQKQRLKERAVEEESALLNCQFYLRTIGGYSMRHQLRQIGGRAGKRWYLITNSHTGKELMMSMMASSTSCALTLSKSTVKTVQNLMAAMRHAYLFPVCHVDYLEEQDLVTLIHPRIPKGSVKDQIYNCKPDEVMHQKYQFRGKPLSEGLIRTYGRQVLEALLFLQQRGFPPCLHLHAGNVFVDGKSCQLGGYELTVFGYPSRMFPLVRRAVKDDMNALEVVLFGHFLYEMLLGQELNVAKAEHHHISAARSSSLGSEVLREIFLKTDGTYPTLKEIKDSPFFSSGVDVSDMERLNTPPPLTSQMKSLLKLVRKGNVPGAAGASASASAKSTKKRNSSSAGTTKTSRPSSRSNANSVSPRPNTSPSPAAAAAAATGRGQGPPPPPPPPPMAAAPAAAASLAPPSSSVRGALLSQIHTGSRLKKTKTNDRSCPKV